MTDAYMNALPVCVRSAPELRSVITEALQILGSGSQELKQLAAKAVQELAPAAAMQSLGPAAAAAPAGAAV